MTTFSKILVANRGEIACRILRTLDRMKIPAAVIYHPMDAASLAVKMAPETVEINGPSPVAAYLDPQNIFTACQKTGADAVHPGFGFLSENTDFARQVIDTGLVFIGPRPETMALMGSKTAARSFCLEHGFPVIPAVTSRETDRNGDQDFAARALKIGMPLLIKAAAGGGGKGMHIVRHPDELENAFRMARAESLRFFGSDDVYAEKYLASPRHIEVQVMGDHHGNLVHLGERECSIQRRFQKIIEESPAPGISLDLRHQICDTAVQIAQKARYCSAGTVEFIVIPSGEFYFLEMNTRLQVEHPVTEMVTGLDLVEMQVRVARGEPLAYTQQEIDASGHAVELRLYAEDPDHDFKPATGHLLVYELPGGDNIRVENGCTQGMPVSPAFDPMLAKLIAHGPTREHAVSLARKALDDTLVLGVTTNVDYLKQILSHPDFAAGRIDTGFIERHRQELLTPPLDPDQRDLLLAAAALINREFNDPAFEVPAPYALMGNWRN